MGIRELGAGGIPRWLCGLVEESFFVGCPAHRRLKKSEKNIFCLFCCTSICLHCAAHHHSHLLLQVRRYIYNDVVRLDELDELIDCSYVQPYTINSAKVIFMKPRPPSRPSKGSANLCSTCDRILQKPFHFCSLSCKVDHFLAQGEDLSSILVGFEDDSQMTTAWLSTAGETVEEEDHDGKESRALSPSSNDNSNNSSRRRRKNQTPRRSFLS